METKVSELDVKAGDTLDTALVPLADVLETISAELRELATSVDGLEALVGNLVVAGGFGGSQSVYEFQTLDRLRQSISGIADFLDAARIVPGDCRVDAVKASQSVTLTALSRRLAMQKDDEGSVDACGSLELFDDVA